MAECEELKDLRRQACMDEEEIMKLKKELKIEERYRHILEARDIDREIGWSERPDTRLTILDRYRKAWECVMSVLPEAKSMYECVLRLMEEDGKENKV